MTFEEQLVCCSIDELAKVVTERAQEQLALGDIAGAKQILLAAMAEVYTCGERLARYQIARVADGPDGSDTTPGQNQIN